MAEDLEGIAIQEKKKNRKNNNHPKGRYYEAEFPEKGELVVARVDRVTSMGAFATLLEYDGQAGMIAMEVISLRPRVSITTIPKNILKLAGRTVVCSVKEVDQVKGYIDLVKIGVEPEKAYAKEVAFVRAKTVHSIMRHVAKQNDLDLKQLCMNVAWPVYKKYQDAFDAFRKHIIKEINLWEDLSFCEPDAKDFSGIARKLQEDIEVDLRKRLNQHMVRLRANVEVSCSEEDGIDAVKRAVLRGLEASREDFKLDITLTAHPLFAISCTCLDKTTGIETMKKGMQLIEESIKADGGLFVVRAPPQDILDIRDTHYFEAHSEEDDFFEAHSESTESEQEETISEKVHTA